MKHSIDYYIEYIEPMIDNLNRQQEIQIDNTKFLVLKVRTKGVTYILIASQYNWNGVHYWVYNTNTKQVENIIHRGVSHEFVRHRVFSFAQESQRYCNYNKDKFNNELTFIKPTWLDIPTGDYTYWDGDWCDIDNMKIQLPSDNGIADNFLWCLNNAGMQYRLLINKGLKPQEARAILPNAIKTELVMTGFESDWEHFFELRCSGAAHPDAKKLADELKSLMNVKNIELNSVK